MDMVQVAWAAIGLLALTVVGMFVALFQLNGQLGARIDAGFQELGRRIDTTSVRMDQGFQALGGRLDTTNSRVDSLAGLLQGHIERHAG